MYIYIYMYIFLAYDRTDPPSCQRGRSETKHNQQSDNNLKCGHEPEQRLDVKTDWLTVSTKVTWTGSPVPSPWRWRQHEPLKCWYPTTTLHGVTTQKTSTWRPSKFLTPSSDICMQHSHRLDKPWHGLGDRGSIPRSSNWMFSSPSPRPYALQYTDGFVSVISEFQGQCRMQNQKTKDVLFVPTCSSQTRPWVLSARSSVLPTSL
jgi:hypothetical protein